MVWSPSSIFSRRMVPVRERPQRSMLISMERRSVDPAMLDTCGSTMIAREKPNRLSRMTVPLATDPTMSARPPNTLLMKELVIPPS